MTREISVSSNGRILVLMATTAGRLWENEGNVLSAIFDDVQEPKSSAKTERASFGVYESILVRLPRASGSILACCFQMHH